MKKVLLVAYYWPPSNSAAAHRPLRFARHLPHFGWQPTVLTAIPVKYMRPDPGVLERVPPSLPVLHAPHRDAWYTFLHWRSQRKPETSARAAAPGVPQQQQAKQAGGLRWLARKLAAGLEARLYNPDTCMGWIGPAVQAARQRFAPGDFDAIWATGGPWSDFEVGYRLARAWGVPLVLDFRDGWTLTSISLTLIQPDWVKRRDRRRLAELFNFAQAVVLMHAGYGEAYLARYPRLDARKIHLIPNGFEPDDLNRQPLPPRGDYLDIVYAGTLQGRRYDTLLLALQRLRPPRLRLTLIGEEWQAAAAQAAQLGLGDMVTCLGPQPHSATTRRLAAAHALLLLGEYPWPGCELFLASKTFTYLAQRRPILAITPPNAGASLVRRLGAGLVADVAVPEDIEAALRELMAAWEADALGRFVPPESALAEFSAPEQTQALIRALEGEPARHPYRRGEVALPPSLHNLNAET